MRVISQTFTQLSHEAIFICYKTTRENFCNFLSHSMTTQLPTTVVTARLRKDNSFIHDSSLKGLDPVKKPL